jgi:hypothetical protein
MCLGYGETKTSIMNAIFRECWSRTYELQRRRHVSLGVAPCQSENLVIEEGSLEAMARLQKQDEEFCRRLRAAIETGRERCPTTIFAESCTNRPVSNYMRPDYKAS